MRRLKQERDQFKKNCKYRSYEKRFCLPISCCYLLSFICGYHEYGTESTLKVILDGYIQANATTVAADDVTTGIIYTLLPHFGGLAFLGGSYILLSVPVAYVLGQMVGYRWAMVIGQLLMYTQGLCGGFACAFNIKCEVASISLLLPFAFGFVIMNVNFIQFALEQVEDCNSAVKSSIINWLWFFFFVGRGTTVFVTSSILFWTYSTYAYLIKVGLAVMSLSLLVWMPFESRRKRKIFSPLITIYRVCKEVFGKCCCKSKKNLQRNHRPRNNFSQTEFPIDHKPNIFEQACENFGGSFPLAEVREVQNVILITFMIFSHLGILIIYSLMYPAYSTEIKKMQFPDTLLSPSLSHFRITQDIKSIDFSRAAFPVATISVIGDLTTIISIAILNGFLYVRFPESFKINRRIVLGAVLGFLTSVVSVITESTRYGYSLSQGGSGGGNSGNVTFMNLMPAVMNSPAGVLQVTHQMDLFSCLPQYVLYGIMTALVIPATSELAGLETPGKYRSLMFGVYFTVMGVAMVTGGFIMFVQMKPDSLWCFFCGGSSSTTAKTGLVTFIITSVLTFLLLLLYLCLSWCFGRVNRIIQPIQTEEDRSLFGKNDHHFVAPHQQPKHFS